jgi:2-polyprenyl-6-methoxyphenol hydroxylase-like FAD-dependent oxidoreductase
VTTDTDIVVVGQGPIGQLISLLLAQRGHSVVCVERHAEPYVLPRAVHYDPDVNRLLSQVGLDREDQAKFSAWSPTYDWFTKDGELMLSLPTVEHGNQGWWDSTMVYQPGLEAALRNRQAATPNISLRRGVTFTGYTQHDDHVEVHVTHEDGTETIQASYLIGADGANSAVRDAMGTPVIDLDFSSDWFVLDFLLDEDAVEFPVAEFQVCDPDRPTTVVRGGPGRRRFEFMLRSDERQDQFDSEGHAWNLVAPWGVTPDLATFERMAFYHFQARYAETWRDGRVFLVGDAAHQMPPFFGRGMVSGVRDVANLFWKLDYVLRGISPESLLDTYASERISHLQFALHMSVELGKVICETDPAKVAERNAHFIANGPLPENVLPPMPVEILGQGHFPAGAHGIDPVTGVIGVQGRLRNVEGHVALPDEFSFGEFICFVDARVVSVADADRIRGAKPEGIPMKVVRVVPDGAALPDRHTAHDVDGRYGTAFDQHGAIAICYRPDYHGFGSARTVEDAVQLVAATGALESSTV